jgi:hypothetical protein
MESWSSARGGTARVLLVLVATAAVGGARAGIVIASDSTQLCATALANCKQQCGAQGTFLFQCNQGGNFGRPTSACQCVPAPPGLNNSGAQGAGGQGSCREGAQ